MLKLKIATTNCGLKYKNRDDLLLISFYEPAAIGGVFTSSSIKAAPVLWCQKHIKKGTAKALLVNAGNANCFTGQNGMEAIEKKVTQLAKLLNCREEEIFVCSTGVIGEKLEVNKITKALPELVKNSCFDESSWELAAKAIMTTDTKHKLISKNFEINENKFHITGIAKGSGMIAPNMATLLSFIFTDVNIAPDILSQTLKEISEDTFNSITVDSDQSTNDTLLAFSTNSANNPKITSLEDTYLTGFKKKLKEICLELAKEIVLDGEGANKIIEIQVDGALNKDFAKDVAMAIGNSPLVKSAIAAADPNWGRIIMAIGKSCPLADQENIDLKIGDYKIISDGEINPNYDEKKVHQYLKNQEVKIEVNLHLGQRSATIYSSDLNEEYVTINKDYRS